MLFASINMGDQMFTIFSEILVCFSLRKFDISSKSLTGGASHKLAMTVYLLISEQILVVFFQSNLSARKANKKKKYELYFTHRVSVSWNNVFGGNSFKIRKKLKHSAIFQTLKYLDWVQYSFKKIPLRVLNLMLIRILCFIYIIPHSMRESSF